MVGTAFITGLGDFSTLSGMFGTPMFTFGQSIIHFIFFNDFTEGYINPLIMMYVGTLAVMVICLMSAAWITVKTAEAAVSFIDGFAKDYRLAS